jgi:hypothetical protein
MDERDGDDLPGWGARRRELREASEGRRVQLEHSRYRDRWTRAAFEVIPSWGSLRRFTTTRWSDIVLEHLDDRRLQNTNALLILLIEKQREQVVQEPRRIVPGPAPEA